MASTKDIGVASLGGLLVAPEAIRLGKVRQYGGRRIEGGTLLNLAPLAGRGRRAAPGERVPDQRRSRLAERAPHPDPLPARAGRGSAPSYVAAVVTPPSTTMVWPVMKVEASEARYATAPAISSGSPIRRSGVPAVRRLRLSGSSHSARAKSVLTRPGATQLTRTPFGPHSPARLRHSAKSAAFEIP